MDKGTEDLLKELVPRVLGALVRRYGDFADAEDAVQEALVAAGRTWPEAGIPDDPAAWLIRVASRRVLDQIRRDEARRRRELLAASWSIAAAEPVSSRDDTLASMFMCCHPVLTPGSAIPLTLRAVGGLTTADIASAFMVTELTMSQRISRAKGRLKAAGAVFALPSPEEFQGRLRLVLRVLYLMFNEGYAASRGEELARADLTSEAVRLTRALHAAVSDEPEVDGLLALMLLTDARRAARTSISGDLIPLAEQDRGLWDRGQISEGAVLVTQALKLERVGEYQVQAAIAALHDEAKSHEATNWAEIESLYGLLERMTGNPMVKLNRGVALAMARGPRAGLEFLEGLEFELGEHHRLHAVRAHLLELAGDVEAAVAEFREAAARASNVRERNYLTTKAAALVN